MPPTRRPGPFEIRDGGSCTLTFRVIPEVPAINRASMTISITGESTGEYSVQATPHFDLTTDEAKTFLLTLRDGDSPIRIADSRSGFQLEFAVADDGPTFTISKPGQNPAMRRFNVGWSFDVKAMAAHLLVDLGP
jgi:hypothetical protein